MFAIGIDQEMFFNRYNQLARSSSPLLKSGDDGPYPAVSEI